MFDFKETADNFRKSGDEFDDTIRMAKVEMEDAIETSLRGFRKHVIAPFWMLMFVFGVVMAGLAGFVIGHGW